MLINIPEKKNKEIFNVLYLFENGKVVFKKKSNQFYLIMEFLMKRDISLRGK